MDEILHEMEKIEGAEGTGLPGLEGWGWLLASEQLAKSGSVAGGTGNIFKRRCTRGQQQPTAQRAAGWPRASGGAVTVTRACSEQHPPGAGGCPASREFAPQERRGRGRALEDAELAARQAARRGERAGVGEPLRGTSHARADRPLSPEAQRRGS